MPLKNAIKEKGYDLRGDAADNQQEANSIRQDLIEEQQRFFATDEHVVDINKVLSRSYIETKEVMKFLVKQGFLTVEECISTAASRNRLRGV